MKNSIKKSCLGAVMLVVAVASLSTARANSITLAFVSAIPDGSGGTFWTYSYSFSNSFLNAGDFMTINDFGAATVTTAPTSPAGTWAFSQALTGPNSLPATDSPTVLNATFTWTGAATNLGAGNSGPFTFTLDSPLAGTVGQLHDYTTLDQSSDSGGTADSKVIGPVKAPQTTPDGASAVTLLGIALAGVEFLRRKLKA